MGSNPLQQYFRQPSLYVQLPTQGKWYTNGEVTLTNNNEVAVYPMGAIDDILLNTPDAMLNGQALEKVVSHCVPDIKNVKRLMLPDLEAIFVGMKSANSNGKADYDRECPKCNHENSFELNCQALLDNMTPLDENDLAIRFDDNLTVYVKPYDFEMRQLFIRREFEEERTIRSMDVEGANLDEMAKASLLAQGVDRLAQITFNLVARSIEKIIIHKDNITVTDPAHIAEWLVSISKAQSDIVIESVNKLNAIGVMKSINVACTNCGHTWEDPLSFDPTSFFGKRS